MKCLMTIDEKIEQIKGSFGTNKIVAVDFDKTLFDHAYEGYPHIGLPINSTIDFIKDLQQKGWKTILWTCRSGKELDMAVAACVEQDLFFDAINSNIDSELDKTLSRKIYASLYIDDKSINPLDIEELI